MTHPVPAAIDKLLELYRGAPALGSGKVRIDDGPPVDGLDRGDALGVGLGVQDAGSTGVATSFDYAGQSDVFDIGCVAQSWSGSTELAPLRTRVYEMFGVAARLVELNRDLGGAVTWARVTRHTYRGMQDEDGALALIEFTVRVDAHREGA